MGWGKVRGRDAMMMIMMLNVDDEVMLMIYDLYALYALCFLGAMWKWCVVLIVD